MKEALYSSTADAKAAKQKQRIYDEYIASMQAGPKDNCGFLIVLPAAGEPLAASILKSYGVTVTETGTIKPEGACRTVGLSAQPTRCTRGASVCARRRTKGSREQHGDVLSKLRFGVFRWPQLYQG